MLKDTGAWSAVKKFVNVVLSVKEEDERKRQKEERMMVVVNVP